MVRRQPERLRRLYARTKSGNPLPVRRTLRANAHSIERRGAAHRKGTRDRQTARGDLELHTKLERAGRTALHPRQAGEVQRRNQIAGAQEVCERAIGRWRSDAARSVVDGVGHKRARPHAGAKQALIRVFHTRITIATKTKANQKADAITYPGDLSRGIVPSRKTKNPAAPIPLVNWRPAFGCPCKANAAPMIVTAS